MRKIIGILLFLINIVCILACGGKKEVEKIYKEKEVEGTLWILEKEGEEGEKIEKAIHFRNGKKAVLKNILEEMIWMYDYDYSRENGEGTIYLFDRKEIQTMMEVYGETELLNWESPVIKKFKREDNVIKYDDDKFEKITMDKLLLIDKNYR